MFIEGSLEVKLPTYGQMQQQLWEQSEKRKSQRRDSQQKEDQRWEKSEKRGRRKKIKVREKVEQSRNSMSFSNVLWLRKVEEQAR